MNNYDREKSNIKVFYWIETFVILLAIWFIMSGIFELKFILYAVGSAAIISTICVRCLTFKGCKTDKTYFMLNCNWWRMFLYFWWLMWQIICSAWYVSKVTLFHREEIDPSVVWFQVDYDNPQARTLLANSITLTPGTITIDIFENGIYSVHGLTQNVKDGVLDGSMQEKIAKVYGETINFRAITK